MYFVAAFSRDKDDALPTKHKLGKRRRAHLYEEPSYDFMYTVARSNGNIDEATRIKAICSLLVQCGLREEGDEVIIDAFGHGNRVERDIRSLLSEYGIRMNGNLLIAHEAGRTFPLVNGADFIAYRLFRQNGGSGFGDREVPFLSTEEAKTYVNDVYKTAR